MAKNSTVTAVTTAADLVRDAVFHINEADLTSSRYTINLAAACVVFVVGNGSDKPALNRLRVMVDDLTNEATRKHVMAWAGKAEPKYGAVARDAMADGPAAARDAVLRTIGDRPWRDVREEFRAARPDKAAKAAPAPSVTDGTATVLPPASSVVPLTALQAVLNRLPELSEAELQRVLQEGAALLAEKAAEREAHVAASVAKVA